MDVGMRVLANHLATTLANIFNRALGFLDVVMSILGSSTPAIRYSSSMCVVTPTMQISITDEHDTDKARNAFITGAEKTDQCKNCNKRKIVST